MLGIKIICVGKLKEKFWADAESEYLRRLSAYCRAEVTELPEQRLGNEPTDGDIRAALQREAQLIRKQIPAQSYTAALCIEGEQTDSESFSKMISGLAVRGVSRLCFIIGGSFGLDEGIKKEAAARVSMSRMTFPHHLARVMLLEQIYRAFKIEEGSKYHK